MRTFKQLCRGFNKFEWGLLKKGAKVQFSNTRCMSAQPAQKFVQGRNGERIIPSPYGNIETLDTFIPEYVWRNVNEFSNNIALECGVTGRKYTYAEARDASNYVARSLRNMGYAEGDIIALITPNLPESAIAFLGILEAGLVVTTINPYYTVEEMAMQLDRAGVKGIIAAREVAQTALRAARSKLPVSVPMIVIDDGTGPIMEDVIPFKDLITRGKELPPLKPLTRSPDDVAVLPFSSGTTGLPKGVMLTHRNITTNIEMVEASGYKIWEEMSSIDQHVIPMFLPFFHIFGMNGVMLPRLAAGAKLVTLPRFMPETFLNVLATKKPTFLYVVPPVILFLSVSPFVKKQHLEHVRAGFSGAAPLAKQDVERLYEKFGLDRDRFKMYQGYGLTESAPVAFLETTGRKYASIGKNIRGCEVRLVDQVTKMDVIEPGKTGELWIRGPHIMKGYYNNPDATREILDDDGWLKTGDIAYFDEDLDFYITDRLKELIKVKGFQVAPAELEALLRTHPSVQEAAVIGIPDQRFGEVPRAYVLLKKDKSASEEEIKNYLKGKVSEYKELNGGVVFVDEIPKNATGKILRVQMKEKFLKQRV
ncbi:hypothetical protein KPH14_004556 [Odynerus spinipes]|uniref:Luciferin 4-monooxygenase n=1 Tax=Odynerus spinipes TaxID=1348599 RepID=A0AAD9RN41_9HYME|nr:hypothetical protein KPH14_004556 [Odynerus spinipes]